jgi:hypothetical protein
MATAILFHFRRTLRSQVGKPQGLASPKRAARLFRKSKWMVLIANLGRRPARRASVMAIVSARRLAVLPATASHPFSLSALKATLVSWTVTFDFAIQSLTCLSIANLCVPVNVLTLIAGSLSPEPRKCRPRRDGCPPAGGRCSFGMVHARHFLICGSTTPLTTTSWVGVPTLRPGCARPHQYAISA